MIADSKTTGNQEQRYSDLAKAEGILLNDQGISPLYYQTSAWMVRPSVKDVIYNVAGANYNFKHAYVAGN